MTKSIEQIALEVVKDLGWSLDAVEHSDMQEFLRRCLTKIGEGLEPTMWKAEATNELDFGGEEELVICLSKEMADTYEKEGGYVITSLYTTPHEAIIAAGKRAEQRVAEACAKVIDDVGYGTNAIRSGEWRKYL